MPRTKIIIASTGNNDPDSVGILFSNLTVKEIEQAIKHFESQLQEGGK